MTIPNTKPILKQTQKMWIKFKVLFLISLIHLF